MTNEQYLYISYFAAITAGLCAAAIALLFLYKPLKTIITRFKHSPLGSIVRRTISPWFITVMVLGFMSVSYTDCQHDTYSKIVADREYLVDKTQDQLHAMAMYLAVSITLYGFLVILYLWGEIKKNSRSRHTD